MRKLTIIISLVLVLAGISLFPFLTKATETPSSQQLIQTLQQQIEQLRSQIKSLESQLEIVQKTKQEIRETKEEVAGTLKLIRQLRPGMSGEDVKILQEILATDPEIYPEGRITGHYGNLTAKAVKRLQLKAGFEQVGNVGPKTLSKLNEILSEGAGKSGKVPPGLLIAPGIRQKLGEIVLSPLPGQQLPSGIEKKLETTTPSNDGVRPVAF